MKTYPYAFVSVVMIAHLYMYVCSKAIAENPFTDVSKDLRKKSNAIPHYDAELDTPLLAALQAALTTCIVYIYILAGCK